MPNKASGSQSVEYAVSVQYMRKSMYAYVLGASFH